MDDEKTKKNLGVNPSVIDFARWALNGGKEPNKSSSSADYGGPAPEDARWIDADPGVLQSEQEGADASQGGNDTAYQTLGAPPNHGVLQPPGRFTYKLGGDKLINEATQTQPEAGAKAVEAIGATREEEHQKLSDTYGEESQRQLREAAIEQAQRQAEQQEFTRRQALLDKKASEIANHQVSRGRFWKSPGNILSAIGASLMTLGSNDPTIGLRLIDNAIQKDVEDQRYDHEQMQADFTGLRTNVGMYRQLVGDRQAGDMLHEAKMRDVAAQKLLQISESLRSKEARNSGLAMAAKMREDAAFMRMQAMEKTYMMPQRVQPDLKRAYEAAGYQNAPAGASPDVAAAGGTSAPPQPKIVPGQDGNPVNVDEGTWAGELDQPQSQPAPQGQYSPQPATGGQYSGGDSYTNKLVNNARQHIKDTRPMSERWKEAEIGAGVENPSSLPDSTTAMMDRLTTQGKTEDDKRAQAIQARLGLPGVYNELKKYNLELRGRAVRATGHPDGSPQVAKWIEERRNEDEKAMATIGAQYLPYAQTDSYISQAQQSLSELRRTFVKPNGETDWDKMDTFLGQNWKALSESGTSKFRRAQDIIGGDELSDKERHAAEEHGQMIMTAINAYIRDTAGQAVNKDEGARVKYVASGDMTSRQIVNFIKMASTARAEVMSRVVATAPNKAVAYSWMAKVGNRRGQLPTPRSVGPK